MYVGWFYFSHQARSVYQFDNFLSFVRLCFFCLLVLYRFPYYLLVRRTIIRLTRLLRRCFYPCLYFPSPMVPVLCFSPVCRLLFGDVFYSLPANMFPASLSVLHLTTRCHTIPYFLNSFRNTARMVTASPHYPCYLFGCCRCGTLTAYFSSRALTAVCLLPRLAYPINSTWRYSR